jgi:hypothetical protein
MLLLLQEASRRSDIITARSEKSCDELLHIWMLEIESVYVRYLIRKEFRLLISGPLNVRQLLSYAVKSAGPTLVLLMGKISRDGEYCTVVDLPDFRTVST